MAIIKISKEVDIEVDIEIDTDDYQEFNFNCVESIINELEKEIDYYELTVSDENAVKYLKLALDIVKKESGGK